MAAQRLHGTIEANIVGADNVHDPSRFTGMLPGFLGHLVQDLEETTGLGKGLSRMYATIGLDGARIARTRSIDAPTAGNPRWNEAVRAYCAHNAAEVVFSVMVEEATITTDADTLLGRAYLPVRELLAGDTVERRLDILDANKRKLSGGPKIHVLISFREVDRDGISFGGGVVGASSAGVPHTFFSERQACRVTLYQDAYVDDETFAPTIPLAGGGMYRPGKCWEDMFDAISNARHLVYLTAWSVFTDITLVRDGRPGGEATLGELLKRKADEGVRVLMLVWNDASSLQWLHSLGFELSAMKTSDEDTARYFRGSRVQCVLCERNMSVGNAFSDGKRSQDTLIFSHHQKTIMVDQELPSAGGRRQIICFLGGLDVCDGRYDTQSHSLFRTIGTGQAHDNDFYQHNFDEDATAGKGGPREPWHDIHSKIEGPAAWDVLHNFEQRWRKQGGRENLLLDLVGLENTVVPSSSPVILPDDQEAWNVQVFRSIDDNSTLGFPDSKEASHEAGLVPGKNQLIDRSIQDAYIHAIRAAKSFIYIENQYFIGSSFQWKADGLNPADVVAANQIPRELSLKIVRKIEAGERFTVYIVIPMWPEGSPSAQTGQATLDWQRRTMEMMYDDIAVALKKMKMDDADPREYLTFFCLGNREMEKSGEFQPAGRPEDGTHYARAQKARRFMIYVHSKMMIVDDEYIIVGSANLNQRSLSGSRDTEIAIGGYQPRRLNTENEVARGQIHGLRMSLWYEHLGITHGDFLDPGSLACVQRVNEMADNYWSLYVADQLTDDLPGHLLAYPMTVNKSGTVSALKGFETFPDCDQTALVRGKKSGIFPSRLTA